MEEAIPRLDKHLNDAYLAGLPSVRIIHGRGTGALRRPRGRPGGASPLDGCGALAGAAAPRSRGGGDHTVAVLMAKMRRQQLQFKPGA